MALAGAGAVACADRFRAQWREAFAAWDERRRKVALRASAEELQALANDLDGVTLPAGGMPALLCLPPRRRSAAEPALTALRPYTDPPRGAPPDGEPAGPPLRYVVPDGVLRTTGKAMAQAGHAALEAVHALGPDAPEAFAAWRAAGCPGEVRVADPEAWARLRVRPDAVVVSDAGLTQVAPGTETVAAFAPGAAPPSELEGLEVLP
jgi:peptidyl-tRNA hydrolase